MANTATVTGKVGNNTTARVNTFTGVTAMNFAPVAKTLSIESANAPSPCVLAIADGATITLTNTGGAYALSIT